MQRLLSASRRKLSDEPLVNPMVSSRYSGNFPTTNSRPSSIASREPKAFM